MQWAAVMTSVGATSEPPQNWRCRLVPVNDAGLSVIAACHGHSPIEAGLPPTTRGERSESSAWRAARDTECEVSTEVESLR